MPAGSGSARSTRTRPQRPAERRRPGAVTHAATTVATGGFSTQTASIAAFDSLTIELGLLWPGLIALVPMLAAAALQQRRESRVREAALDDLESELIDMDREDRDLAVRAFQERFPSWSARRRLHRRIASAAE